MNFNDDFAFSHSVVQGMPGAAGVRVGIIEDDNDKIAFVNHVLVAVEVGVVAAFIVTFVRLGNFQNEVWICLLFFEDNLACPGVNAECVTVSIRSRM